MHTGRPPLAAAVYPSTERGSVLPHRCSGFVARSFTHDLGAPSRGRGFLHTLGGDQGQFFAPLAACFENGSAVGSAASGVPSRLAASVHGAHHPRWGGSAPSCGVHPLQPGKARPGQLSEGLAMVVISSICSLGGIPFGLGMFSAGIDPPRVCGGRKAFGVRPGLQSRAGLWPAEKSHAAWQSPALPDWTIIEHVGRAEGPTKNRGWRGETPPYC